MSNTATVTKAPADMFQYNRDLIRTGKFLPLGRMRTIAVGPCASYTPPPHDPIISGWGDQPQRNARGRMIDLSNQWLPIGQDPITGAIVCPAPLRRADGFVGLPDLVDPRWRAAELTAEEAMNPDCSVDCRQQWDIVPGSNPPQRVPHKHVLNRAGKDTPRLIPQRLEDRTNDVLLNTNFMCFRPIERITYQPEDMKTEGRRGFMPAEWRISFRVDGNGDHCAFVVDYNHVTGKGSGECHFIGGIPLLEGDARG